MKQIFQNLRTGAAETLEIPTPHCPKGCVLVQSQCSLISPGTERMLADFGRGGWISKARQQPDKVKQVLQKMRTDGVEATVRAVFSKLDQPLPVGYSNVGTVIQVGEGVKHLKVLDRVVSNGYHAELVAVPENLVAKIPDDVSDEAAAFTVLGAIALQGVRLAAPSLGETFSVFGLGLLGVLTCQILKANGCKVIGIDISEERVETAKRFGVEGLVVAPNEDPTERVINANGGQEVDGVLITASTRSNGPIASAPRMTRKRGRIILVGVVGLNLERTEFFKKELTFQVSCSYGPGRYDEGYEKEGLDYPVGYVRWTEQRNFEAVLELIRAGNLDVRSLVTERIPFTNAATAYDRILTDGRGYGYLFQYPSTPLPKRTRIDLVQNDRTITSSSGAPSFGFIGAGNYARGVLIPSFAATEAKLSGIVSQSGAGSADLARKFGFAFHATDVAEVLTDNATNAIVIATRHNTHAALAVKALQAGKHVFVEKPLAMTREEALQVKKAFQSAAHQALMVGFNRRYAPLSERLATLLHDRSQPISFRIAVNAGAIPGDHWTQNSTEGGGRIIGELCHFIDYAHFLTGCDVTKVIALALQDSGAGDTVAVTLQFEDGSVGSIDYFANGHKGLPKERIEVFSSGRVLELNNFLSLKLHGFKGQKDTKHWRQDKGQNKQAEVFLSLLAGVNKNAQAIADSAFRSMETTFKIIDALEER